MISEFWHSLTETKTKCDFCTTSIFHLFNKTLQEISATTEGNLDTEATLPIIPEQQVEGEDQPDVGVLRRSEHLEAISRTVNPSQDATKQCEVAAAGSKSYLRRVLTAALPIQILLFLCTILILVLPTVVVTFHGDCYLSLTENLMLESPGPFMSYVRGPPPV